MAITKAALKAREEKAALRERLSSVAADLAAARQRVPDAVMNGGAELTRLWKEACLEDVCVSAPDSLSRSKLKARLTAAMVALDYLRRPTLPSVPPA